MLENYFVDPKTIERIRASWMGSAIEKYVGDLAEQRYSTRCILNRVPALMRFGTFAWDKGARKLGGLPRHVNAFVDWRLSTLGSALKNPLARRTTANEIRNPIEQMLRLVVPGFVGTKRIQRLVNPFESQTPAFFGYLRDERGLKESTLFQYSYGLRQFADYLTKIGLTDLSRLSVPILYAFVVEFAKRPLSLSIRSNLCGFLRVFLSYLFRQGILAKNLGGAVEFPRAYRLVHVPRSITWEEVRQVLQVVDRHTVTGKRDFAMLLLLVAYGLRAHEVANLTLGDIDWKNDRIRIPQRKAGHSSAYPLSPIVGKAILDYLKKGRPKTDDRHVFFGVLAPCKPISSGAVVHRAGFYLRKVGIKAPRLGAHTFRHTCAQRLVDAEFTLKTIGDYMGHRSSSSTEIYTKVDIEGLREVACGDGEEAL